MEGEDAEEDDEELDTAMISMHKPVKELENKGKDDSVWQDIVKCFTVVRDE
jgi:hypothetical protein